LEDITLNVGLEAGDVQNTAEELRNELERAFNTPTGNVSAKFKSLQQQIAKAYDKSNQLVNKMEQLEHTPTPEYASLKKTLEDSQHEAERLAAVLAKMLENGAPIKDIKSTTAQWVQLDQHINETRTKLQEMHKNGTAYAPQIDTDAYRKLTSQLNDTNNQMVVLKQRAQEAGMVKPQKPSLYERLKGAVTNLAGAFGSAYEKSSSFTEMGVRLAGMGLKNVLVGAANGAKMLALGVADAARRFAGFTVEKAKNGLKSLRDRAKDAAENLKKLVGQGIISGIKKLGSAMLGLNKSTKSSNNALNVGFKTLLRYGLGIRSVFFLVKRLRAQLIEGFGNLSQYSEPFNQTVSAFLSSLYTLKNAFAAAFAPIISVVAPILTTFLDMLNQAIAKVGEFLYAITGQKMYITAKKLQVNYAESLDKSSKSTDKASKATKKNTKATKDYKKTIAGFDDVEILKDPDKNKTDDTSGAGAGSGTGGTVTPTGADMFETKPISTAMSEFANKIRDFIKNQDWTGLGTFLGQQINSVFTKAQKLISWKNLGGKITKIVTAITQTLNALIKAVDWNLIGSTFATGINTIIYTMNLLLTGIDWYAIGNAFASGLNGLISNIDWAALGSTLGAYINAWIHTIQGFVENFDWVTAGLSLATGLTNIVQTIDWTVVGSNLSIGIIGALNFLSSAIEHFDWEGLGQNVAKFVGAIDWSGVATALFKALGAVLGGLTAFLWGLIQGAWSSVVTWWEQTAFKDGQFTMLGLLKGILDALANLGQWIYNNIFQPFIKGFKKAFGISSPSKVMQEQGNFIVAGLLKGLSDKWHTITSFITKKIDEIKNFFFNGGWKKVGDDVLTKLHDSITNSTPWKSITSTVSDAVSDIKGYFEDTDWDDIGSNIMSGIEDGIESGWNWLSITVSNVASDLLEAAKNTLGIASPSKVFRDTVGKMIPAGLAEGVLDEQNLAIKAVVSMSDAVQDGAIKNLQIPAVVTGEVVPFTSKYSNQDEANNALNRIIDMLQYNQDENISLDDLRDILIEVIRDYLNINFSIGDEQLARHVNRGNERLDRRFSSTKLSVTRG